jgi:hypothetical protein
MSEVILDTPTADVENGQVRSVTPDSKGHDKENVPKADAENGSFEGPFKLDSPTTDEDEASAKDSELQHMESAFKDEISDEIPDVMASRAAVPSQPSPWNPKKRWMIFTVAILAACVFGALIVIIIAIVNDQINRAMYSLLITFAVLAICIVPISCYAGMMCIANDQWHDHR